MPQARPAADRGKVMKTITVLPNRAKDKDLRVARAIAARCESLGAKVQFSPTPTTDLVVVIGGDGSILRAARTAAPLNIPLLGVNLGRLGYMAEIECNEISLIDRYFKGEYDIEERMMLSVETVRRGKSRYAPIFALNDAVISNGAVSRMVDISLLCNGNEAGNYRADGIIAATPTGSSAYSLSAGGPVIDPAIQCICITPVCPQSLRARPMIFSGDSVLEIRGSIRSVGELYLTVDGFRNYRLERDDVIRITRSAQVTKLIKLKKNSFYDVLYQKNV